MPVKYSDELKARAVDLVLHARADQDSAHGAITRVANELGLSKETLRVWMRKHKNSGQEDPAESVGLEVENRRLRAELAEARRANEILRTALACCLTFRRLCRSVGPGLCTRSGGLWDARAQRARLSADRRVGPTSCGSDDSRCATVPG